MIPLKLTLKNFLSYQNPVPLDFRHLKIAVLSGLNGVGKSSLLEAITWALWGKTRAQSSDDLIYQGKNKCFVELIFKTQGNVYRIFRQRERKKRGGVTSLIFQIAKNVKQTNLAGKDEFLWQELTGPTIKNTQQDIVKTLNLTYDVFINSSYLQQDKADEFTLKPPQQRKEILSQILNLDRFGLYEEKSRERLKELEQRLKVLEFSVEDKKQTLENLKSQKQNWQKVHRQYQKAIVELSDRQKAYKKNQRKIQKLQAQQTELKNLKIAVKKSIQDYRLEAGDYQRKKQECEAIKEIKQAIEKLKFDPAKLERLRKQAQELNEKSQRQYQLKIQKQGIEEEKKKLKTELIRLKRLNICPTCQQKVTQTHFKKIAKLKKREFLEKYREQFGQISLELKKLTDVAQKLNETKQKVSELEHKIEKHSQLVTQKEGLLKQKKLLPIEKEKILKRKKQLEEEGKKIKELENGLIGFETKLERHRRLEREIEEKQEIVHSLSRQIGAIEEQKEQINKIKIELEKNRREAKRKIGQKALLEQLIFVFSQRGAPAQIIAETIPQIEAEANRILEQATSGRMKVALKTKRLKKSAEGEIDTLDIIISDELGERPYELFSGGEAFRINFSVRVALSRLLSIRAGAKLKFLAIDEGFGSLDSAGQEDIVKAIKSVEQDFEKIIVISHIDEIRDAFDQAIVVSKGKEGSELKVI